MLNFHEAEFDSFNFLASQCVTDDDQPHSPCRIKSCNLFKVSNIGGDHIDNVFGAVSTGNNSTLFYCEDPYSCVNAKILPSSIIMPIRFFTSGLHGYTSEPQQIHRDFSQPGSLECLIYYCDISKMFKHLKINCIEFIDSSVWNRHLEWRKVSIAARHPTSSKFPLDKGWNRIDYNNAVIPFLTPNPTKRYFYPNLQKMLSYTAKLLLAAENSKVAAVPVQQITHLLLSNIISNKSPCLETIEIDAPKDTKQACYILSTVAEFLCKSRAPLPEREPYKIHFLSINVYDHLRFSSFHVYNEHIHVLTILKDIVEDQMDSLKRLVYFSHYYTDNPSLPRSLPNIFISTDYVRPLFSTLITLLQQPQFQSLSIDLIATLEDYCKLITAFLTTPASHDQELSIDLGYIMSLEPMIADLKPFLPSSNLPSTNIEFKSLDLSSTDTCVSQVVASLPILLLKKLRISIHSLAYVPHDACINIRHVFFEFDLDFNDALFEESSYDCIGSFFSNNSVLKIFEISSCKYKYLETINFLLFCIYSKRETLEEIHLHCDSPLRCYIQYSDLELLTVHDDFILDDNPTLLHFFSLLRMFKEVTIFITLYDVTYNNYDVNVRRHVLKKLVRLSGEGKAKKIVLRKYDQSAISEDIDVFEQLAEEVTIEQ